MLIDTHCHLDFPDFAPEQAEIVARAKARGVGRMITISTHLSRFDRVKAVAEAYPEVFCTVGTHPHHSHEEEEPTVGELVALSRHPKCVGLGEAGLDYHYDHAPREVARAGVPHPYRRRPRDRPAARHPHSRRRRRLRGDPARGNGEGGLPGPAPLLHLQPRAGRNGGRTGSLHLLFRRRDLQELRGACARRPKRFRWSGCWSRPTRHSSRPSRIAASATSRPLSSTRPGCWPRSRASPRRTGAGDDRKRAAALLKMPPLEGRRVTLDGHDPRLFVLRRRAARRAGLGKMRSRQPKNRRRRCSILSPAAMAGRHADPRRHRPGFARAARRRRGEQARRVLYTHPHADHTHGIDDLRGLVIRNGRRIPAYMDEPTSRDVTPSSATFSSRRREVSIRR